MGIGDPHRIVFHFPVDSSSDGPFSKYRESKLGEDNIPGVSEETLVNIIQLLKKYLLDDDEKVVDVTSRALQVSLLRLDLS